MRLAASLVATTLALSTPMATPVAEACGGEMPRPPAMFVIAQHHGRTFVLLGNDVPVYEKLDWKGDPMSYDRTEIAAAPALYVPRQLTLVGAKRTRSLSSRNQVFITPVFESHRAMNALEIFPGRAEPARIAIEGEHKTAWTDLDSVETSAETIAWAEHPGFSPALDAQHLYVTKAKGTDLELISAFGSNGLLTTYVRSAGGTPWGGYTGSPLGIVTVDGARYMVLVNDGRVTPIRV